jgi:hypothetical protein
MGFQAPGFRVMSFGIGFQLPRPKNMSYLCMNLSGTNQMLQLKLSHGLTDIIVIDRF